MQEATRKQIAELARSGCVLIATADARGLPHLTAAKTLDWPDADHVAVSDWFCPGCAANVQRNPRVSVTVWEPGSDSGYQLLGEVDALEDLDVLDGYDPPLEQAEPVPSVRRRFRIRVEKVLAFSQSPHPDTPIAEA